MATIKTTAIYFLIIIAIFSFYYNIFSPINYYFYSIELFISSFLILLVISSLIIKFKTNTSFCSINKLDIFILIFYFYNILNIFIFNKSEYNSKEFIQFSIIISAYFVLKHFFYEESKSPQFCRNISIFILTLNTLPIIEGLCEFFSIIPTFDKQFLVCGGLMNPGAYANFIATIFPFTLAILLYKKSSLNFISIWAIVNIVITIAIIIITNSRTAWIAIIISSIFLLIHKTRISKSINTFLKSKWKLMLSIILISIFVFLSTFLYNYKKNSADGRLLVWKISTMSIKDKPILGHGFNSFYNTYNTKQESYFRNYNGNDNLLAADATFAFNDFIQIALELGILGLILFLLMIIYSLRNNNISAYSNKFILIGTKSCIISLIICALFSYPLKTGPNILLLYIFFAVISSQISPLKKFTIPSNILKVLIVTFLLIFSYVGYNLYLNFSFRYYWKMANISFEHRDYTKSLNLYEKIKFKLNDNFEFLFNYGTVLSINRNYIESINYLELAKQIHTKYDLYINLANSYENIDKYNEAETNYLHASYLIPHKFTPKYNLLKLYIKSGQFEKAKLIANIIVKMPIKVYSQQVGQIKNEALKYLNEYSNDPSQ